MGLNEKIKFLMDEFWMLSIQDAFSHVSIYNTKNDDQRKKFKNSLKNYVNICLLPYYLDSSLINDAKHITNIIYISLWARKHKIINNFSIGIAKKLLNLYLKYLWCAGLIDMPLHCPFDSNIVKELKGMNFIKNRYIAWTKMGLKDYVVLVDAARRAALENGTSIAVWELKTFNNKRFEK